MELGPERNIGFDNIDLKREQARKGVIVLTSAYGFNLLEKGIQNLNETIQREQLEMGASANNDSDLRENPGFMQSRLRLQNQLPAEMARLNRLKSQAEIYEEKRENEICFGSVLSCTVDYGGGDIEDHKFVLLGPIEKEFDKSNSEIEVLSYLSPMGAGLWGKKIGPTKSLSVQINEKSRVKVSNIQFIEQEK